MMLQFLNRRGRKSAPVRRRVRPLVEMLEDRLTPSISPMGVGTITGNEGSEIDETVATFTESDPNAEATDFSAMIYWGDGSSSAGTIADTGGGNFEVDGTHTYGDDGAYSINVIISGLGDVADCTSTGSIANVAPDLTISGDNSVNEGAQYTLNLSSSDPGQDNITSWRITWGDGTPEEVVQGNPNSATHTFAVFGQYQITAKAQDEDGLHDAGNNKVVNVNNVQPALANVSWNEESNKYVTITGAVVDSSPGNLLITITGVVSATGYSASNGTFSIYAQASQLGNFTVTVEDAGSMESDPVMQTITSDVPDISNFTATLLYGTTWIIRGRVTDEHAQGLTVTLGGLESADGETGTVDSTGWFQIQVTFEEDENGTVSAVVSDWWGQESDDALTSVTGN